MKIAAILRPLDEFTKWYAGRGLALEAETLQGLTSLLKEYEHKNVSGLIALIRGSRLEKLEGVSSSYPTTLKLRELQDMLAWMARVADSLGRSGHAADLRVLGDVLVEEAVPSAAAAFVQIRSRLAHPPALQSNSPARAQQQSTRPTVSVDEYVRRLECATDDADIFPLLQEFRKRGFKKDKLDQIAHRFAKGPEKYRRKADAIEDIEGRFHQRKRAVNEIDFLERKKVTPW